MLTEQFIASVGVPTRPPGTSAAKDVAIFVQEYQPLNTQRTVFKKSATSPNCLAVSDSHVFAAQTEKAVVHVYNRQKGNQEATVPFTERITCTTLACNDTVLVLGTGDGRIFFWETATGRQITTAQSHLQTVTVLAVDLTSNFLLSASADSTIHVWSIPALLSFDNSAAEPSRPLRTFTSHRSKVNALVVGHGSQFCNIAVSASADKTCLVWDYFTNNVLRTYLLTSEPICLALDVADRAAYVGYEAGSIQQLDFFAQGDTQAGTPIQPPRSSIWHPSDSSIGPALCLSISFDGCTVISGHQSGNVLAWETARACSSNSILQNPSAGPITNLSFLPVTGFAVGGQHHFRIRDVVKPKFGAFDGSSGGVPANYVLNLELLPALAGGQESEFECALDSPYFSTELIDAGVEEMFSVGKFDRRVNDAAREPDDFMALDDEEEAKPRQLSLEEQNTSLRTELEALRRLQRASFDKLERVNAEKKALLQREQKRLTTQNPIQPNGDGTTHRSIDTLGDSSDAD